MDSYALPIRPLPASTRVTPVVDLRERTVDMSDAGDLDAWEWCRHYVDRFVAGTSDRAGRRLTDDTIKGFDRNRGADHHQLATVLDALDHGRPVAFYGWWPTAAAAAVTDILGVDAIEVPPPSAKGSALVDGHAVVVLGYARHDAFPGGGYLIVRNPWPDRIWGDRGYGYLPFTYVRTYAIMLQSARIDSGYLRSVELVEEPDGPPTYDLPIGPSGNPADAEIARKARCADPRASYTALFFSENAIDTARAKAICSRCEVRELCLTRALERREPYGVWGGEFLIDGEIVVAKRGRGRPRTIPLPADVDEITGMPVVA
jgi:WhiB family redox-sensing transcriptional regulator